jgi:Putative prokaryotic signal transducing protein
MIELLRTNDLVLLTFASHVLDEAGIEHVIFDSHMSAVEGSIGILPRRLMVDADDVAAARRVLANASPEGCNIALTIGEQ